MKIKNDELYKSILKFTQNSLNVIESSLQNNKKYISRHFEYPTVSYKKNGLPSLSTELKGPIEIFPLFNKHLGKEPIIQLLEIDGYHESYELISNLEEYNNKYNVANFEDHIDFYKKRFLIDFVARYYHEFSINGFNEQNFQKIYTPKENFLYNELLFIEISVPILLLTFDCDEHKINDTMYIKKITDKRHLARKENSKYSHNVNDALIASASHELILYNYEFKNTLNQFTISHFLSDKEKYPLRLIDSFFNAIKIITNFNTGYAQLLSFPQDWVVNYFTDLPPIYGTTVRQYPIIFDNYLWNSDDIRSLNNDEIIKVSQCFNKLNNCENNKIKFSEKRLRYSYLRENEEDSILDIIIALEMMLGDKEKTELSHKLALRAAKLISKYKNENSIEVFKAIKKIYNYRSSIVHGSTKQNKLKTITLEQTKKEIPSIILAEKYLRSVLEILLEYPKYLNPQTIDEELLLS